MTDDTDRPAWDDARIVSAYHALVGREAPPDLADRIAAGVADRTGSRGPLGRWPRARLERGLAAAFGAIGMAVVLVAVTMVLTPPISPGGHPSDGTSARPRASGPAASLPPVVDPSATFPSRVGYPGAASRSSVRTVSEAIAIRDDPGRDGPVIVNVGGWFAQTRVPCAILVGATSPLESCLVRFTWLMESPEQLHELASDGSGTVRAPSGPAVNVVLAFIDSNLPSDGRPVPVVFQGHFGDERSSECPEGERRARCDDLYVVDTVAWTLADADSPAALPAEVMDLPVMTVPEALEFRARGSSEELAVEGWFDAPPILHCSPGASLRPVPLLSNTCEGLFTVLMLDPEALIELTPGSTSAKEPTGPAFRVSFGTTLGPPLPPLPASGTSTPVHVVFVGHFHDRRAELCATDDQPDCGSRFVVDRPVWVEGYARTPLVAEFRSSTDAWPQPSLDPVDLARSLEPAGTLLGVATLPGWYVGQVEPALAVAPTDLSTEPAVWVVTLLAPSYCAGQPQSCVGLEGPRAVTIVVTADGMAYRDAGPGFEPVPEAAPEGS